MSSEPLSEEQLLQKIEAWKSLMCPDWDVVTNFLTFEEMQSAVKKATLGACNMNPIKKQAFLRLLKAEDYPKLFWLPGDPSRGVAFEQERVAVHELMHTRFALLDDLIGFGNVAEAVFEQGLHGLDVAFVELAHAAQLRAKEVAEAQQLLEAISSAASAAASVVE